MGRLALKIGAFALGIVLAAGCASTGLVNVWSQPGFNTPMKHLLVISVSSEERNRRIIEDAFVKSLTQRGLQASPSYNAFPTALPDTQQVRDYVLANGFDGVLVTAHLPNRSVTAETPGYTTVETRTVYNNWSGRYHDYLVHVQHEGTTVVQKVVPHRVDLWFSDGKGGQIVWTGETNSVDPSSTNDVSREMVGAIVPELAKAGLIPGKR